MPRNPDTLFKLLPVTSTKLEKDILKATPFEEVLVPGINLIAGAKGAWSDENEIEDEEGVAITPENGIPISAGGHLTFTPRSNDWVPWLAIELNVNRFSEFITDPAKLISVGTELNRLTGTPRAVNYAMELIGFAGSKVWERETPSIHFPEYEINLSRIPQPYECCKIWRFTRRIQPVRSRLRRLWHGHNIRPLILSKTPLDRGYLSDSSGIKLDAAHACEDGATGMKVSFRNHHPDEVTLDLDFEDNYYRIHTINSVVGLRRFPRPSNDFDNGDGTLSFYDLPLVVGQTLPTVLWDEECNEFVDEDNVPLIS